MAILRGEMNFKTLKDYIPVISSNRKRGETPGTLKTLNVEDILEETV